VGLGLSHSDAVLAEFLLSEDELELPSRIQRQLEWSSAEELLEIRKHRDLELIRHLCLEVDCDRQWESLPNDVRVLLVKRVCGESCEINETQLQFIKSRSRVPDQVYLGRRDLHCFATLMIDDYTTSLLRHPVQQTVPTRCEVSDDLISRLHKEVESTPRKTILSPLINFVQSLRTCVKFTVLVLIAEPEFQRELAYLLRGSWRRPIIMFLATRFWIYARILQDLLVPFFIVCPLIPC
jgi:hypothetical protein